MGIYIKGFKPKDGLYVIKDGEIRKYKGNGGTVRPYELIEVKEPHGRLIDAETIDAVEVVRCRDCKNRAKYAVCDFLGEDGFCSHGERREDGEA